MAKGKKEKAKKQSPVSQSVASLKDIAKRVNRLRENLSAKSNADPSSLNKAWSLLNTQVLRCLESNKINTLVDDAVEDLIRSEKLGAADVLMDSAIGFCKQGFYFGMPQDPGTVYASIVLFFPIMHADEVSLNNPEFFKSAKEEIDRYFNSHFEMRVLHVNTRLVKSIDLELNGYWFNNAINNASYGIPQLESIAEEADPDFELNPFSATMSFMPVWLVGSNDKIKEFNDTFLGLDESVNDNIQTEEQFNAQFHNFGAWLDSFNTPFLEATISLGHPEYITGVPFALAKWTNLLELKNFVLVASSNNNRDLSNLHLDVAPVFTNDYEDLVGFQLQLKENPENIDSLANHFVDVSDNLEVGTILDHLETLSESYRFSLNLDANPIFID